MAVTPKWFMAGVPNAPGPLRAAFRAYFFAVSAALGALARFAGLVLARPATSRT